MYTVEATISGTSVKASLLFDSEELYLKAKDHTWVIYNFLQTNVAISAKDIKLTSKYARRDIQTIVFGLSRNFTLINKNEDILDYTLDNTEVINKLKYLKQYGHVPSGIIRMETSKIIQGKTARKDKKSRFIGVAWVARSKTWRARVTYRGETFHLGYHLHEIDAAKAYNKKALELYGKSARLNDI